MNLLLIGSPGASGRRFALEQSTLIDPPHRAAKHSSADVGPLKGAANMRLDALRKGAAGGTGSPRENMPDGRF
jgi:hypothetical protein